MRKTIIALLTISILITGLFAYQVSLKNEHAILTADLENNTTSLATSSGNLTAGDKNSLELKPNATHRKITRNVLNKTERDHYAQKKLNSELSTLSFERYLEMLDGNKHYFLSSDIKEFSHLKAQYRSALNAGKPEIAFKIFERYQERARDRLQYSLDLLAEQPDLTGTEQYFFDRDELGYVESESEWNTIWRQRVTNDIINQFLAEKNWEDTQKTLRTRYSTALRQIDQQQPDDVFQLFLNSYIDSLDPHSGYFNPKNEDERNIQSSLTYSGIGATLTERDEYVSVVNIIPGGPAEITKLVKIDDRIIGVGQEGSEVEEVFGWRLDDVVQLIRGPSKSKVTLRLLRTVSGSGEKEIEILLERDQIKLEAQAAKKEVIEMDRDGSKAKVGVITIPSFYQDYRGKHAGDPDYKSTTKDVYNLLQELKSEDVQGVIIDLRNNGGGNLEEAITLTGLFIDEGPVVQFRAARNRTYVYKDTNELTRIAYTGPLTVLVNRYSASASEIFAAALQDYQRAVIVGQTTFGKGTVQEQIPLDNTIFKGSERYGLLSLTIGKFYRVNGGSTQHRGVIPDIELPSYIDAEKVGESTEKSALEWDQIGNSYYQVSGDVSGNLIAELQKSQALRSKADPDMIFFQNDISSLSTLRNRKSISLSLEQRRTEREYNELQRLQRENERRLAQGLEVLADVKALEDSEAIDVQLDQTKHVLLDLMDLSALSLKSRKAAKLLTGTPPPTDKIQMSK